MENKEKLMRIFKIKGYCTPLTTNGCGNCPMLDWCLANNGFDNTKAIMHEAKKQLQSKKLEKELIGDLFLIDMFIKLVNDGCFCGYDGVGEWLDKDKKVIEGLPSLSSKIINVPEEAKYVLWHNK